MGAVPARGDAAASVVLALLGLAEIWLTPPSGLSAGQRIAESSALLVIAAMFAFRTRWPTAAALVALVALALASAWTTDSRVWDIAVVMFATYSAARHARRAGAWVVLGASVAYGLFVTSLEDNEGFWMYFGNFLFLLVLMILIPWAAGLALRRRQELSRGDAERAVVDERLRIAQELHDVVGHALAVIVVQAEGERAQLPADALESTREALGAIAQSAREALDDIRRLLRVMRADGGLGPQPGLRDLQRLLDAMTAAGLPSELVIEGSPQPLPPGVDLSAYRVVQEALTNSLRHSRDARARVSLTYTDAGLDIEVTDDGCAAPPDGPHGFGLVGMRERVALFGGSLHAGPRPDRGFAVRVHLPVRGGVVDDAPRSRV
jgi:signal transduction histidine kinase